MKEEYNPWLLCPPFHRVPSCHRVTPLQLSYLLFSRVAALFPPLQVRGIGLAASSGHGVTWVCSSACPSGSGASVLASGSFQNFYHAEHSPASAFSVAGMTGMHHCTWLKFVFTLLHKREFKRGWGQGEIGLNQIFLLGYFFFFGNYEVLENCF